MMKTAMDRRSFLISVGLGAAGIAAAPMFESSAWATTTPGYLAYSADSFFKSTVMGAPVAATATASFRTFMRNNTRQKLAYPIIKGLLGSAWGMPYAEGSAADPIWTLTGHVPSAVADLATTGFHAPSWLGQQLTGSSDSPFVVMDRGRGITLSGFNAYVSGPNQIHVQDAGYYRHASNGLDRRNPRSDSTQNARARGIIPDAMMIRRDCMDDAIANGTDLGYVLHMFFVETRTAAGYCHPMVGCETNRTGWGSQGLRIAIDPSVDLTTRGLSPAGLAVARTLQRRGCYLGDNAGSGSSLKAEQSTTYHDPWAGLDFNKASLAGITWDDFVVLPKGWQ